jgi:hypothetical protein
VSEVLKRNIRGQEPEHQVVNVDASSKIDELTSPSSEEFCNLSREQYFVTFMDTFEEEIARARPEVIPNHQLRHVIEMNFVSGWNGANRSTKLLLIKVF